MLTPSPALHGSRPARRTRPWAAASTRPPPEPHGLPWQPRPGGSAVRPGPLWLRSEPSVDVVLGAPESLQGFNYCLSGAKIGRTRSWEVCFICASVMKEDERSSQAVDLPHPCGGGVLVSRHRAPSPGDRKPARSCMHFGRSQFGGPCWDYWGSTLPTLKQNHHSRLSCPSPAVLGRRCLRQGPCPHGACGPEQKLWAFLPLCLGSCTQHGSRRAPSQVTDRFDHA